jgi:hypothetical protein
VGEEKHSLPTVAIWVASCIRNGHSRFSRTRRAGDLSAMRMYFNIRDGDILIKDATGQKCDSIGLGEAELSAQEILSDRVKFGHHTGQQQFEVVDEAGV